MFEFQQNAPVQNAGSLIPALWRFTGGLGNPGDQLCWETRCEINKMTCSSGGDGQSTNVCAH